MTVITDVKSLMCLVCGKVGPGDIHHVKSRGAGGKDDLWNIMPLCRQCHCDIHRVGMKYHAENYPMVKRWLELNDWEYCTIKKAYIHVNFPVQSVENE